MGAATAETATAARGRVLDGIADAALAQEAEAEARKVELAEAEAGAAKRRAGLSSRLEKLSAERLEAVAAAEKAAGALVAALSRIHTLAADEHTIATELGVPAQGLWFGSVARRLSGYLSDALRDIPASTPRRYGELGLTSTPTRGATWAEAEAKATGTKTGENNENADTS